MFNDFPIAMSLTDDDIHQLSQIAKARKDKPKLLWDDEIEHIIYDAIMGAAQDGSTRVTFDHDVPYHIISRFEDVGFEFSNPSAELCGRITRYTYTISW